MTIVSLYLLSCLSPPPTPPSQPPRTLPRGQPRRSVQVAISMHHLTCLISFVLTKLCFLLLMSYVAWWFLFFFITTTPARHLHPQQFTHNLHPTYIHIRTRTTVYHQAHQLTTFTLNVHLYYAYTHLFQVLRITPIIHPADTNQEKRRGGGANCSFQNILYAFWWSEFLYVRIFQIICQDVHGVGD